MVCQNIQHVKKNILCKNRIRSGFHVTEELRSNFKNSHSDFIYSAFKKRTSLIQDYRHITIKAKGDPIQIKKGFKHFNLTIKIFRKYA